MSYEMLRFGWQKLLIHNVPHKGRKYVAAPSAPPPRDWSPEWNQVTAAGQAAIKNLEDISKGFSTGGGAAAFAARQAELNAKIAATTTQIDQAIALNNTIPASWFGDKLADRNAAISNLQQTRANLNRYIGTWTPNKIDLISDEIDRQTLLLATQNRSLKGPIQMMAADAAYPSGSWQYAMWSKGYMLHEISWAEEEITRDPAILAAANDYEYYKKLIEDKIQDAIVVGKIPPAEKKEIIQPAPKDYAVGYEPWFGTGTLPIVRTPTGPIGGVGTYVVGGPVGRPVPSPELVVYGEDGVTYEWVGLVPAGIRWSKQPWVATGDKLTPNGDAESGVGAYAGGPVISVYDPVYGEDGQVYGNTMLVPKGVRWSRKPWKESPINSEPKIPVSPIGLVPGTPDYRVWERRQRRRPVFGNPGRPTVPYLDYPGWNTPPSIELPRPTLPPGQGFLPRCGTGIVTNQPWESVMIGEGCTISHLDTIRKFFTTAKLKPGANQVEIARSICVKLKNQDAQIPDVTVVSPIDISQQSPVLFNLDTPDTAVTNSIPGVRNCGTGPRTIAAQNLAARRQASRVRRGAFR